jgi:hypothetical protein
MTTATRDNFAKNWQQTPIQETNKLRYDLVWPACGTRTLRSGARPRPCLT